MSTSNAQNLRNNPTKAEYLLWYYLKQRQTKGLKFRRQQKLGRYIVDFVCYEKRLIIELDGGQHATQQRYDADRTQWLESQGFRVLRFWNNQVLASVDIVLDVINKDIG